MTRLLVIAALVWSIALAATSFHYGRRTQADADAAEQVQAREDEAELTRIKNRKSLAASIRTERVQAKTDTFFQQLRATYEIDQTQNPGIGCVLDPVSLRRWNDANAAQPGGDAAGDADDPVPQPAGADGRSERGE